eukprot:scaffold19138_cov53-Attheya_sp.AAC.2
MEIQNGGKEVSILIFKYAAARAARMVEGLIRSYPYSNDSKGKLIITHKTQNEIKDSKREGGIVKVIH